MDPCTSRVILPAMLGIAGAIVSGCLGGLVGYALPLHTNLLRRRLSGPARDDPQPMSDSVVRGRLYGRQGLGRVELRPGANLRAVDLAGRNLEAVDVRRANIEGANLQGAILQRANLESANLSGSNLWGAYLLGADLRRCDLRYAMLRDADFAGANLLGANLRGAVLARASLSGANLEGAGLSGADLSETDLRWVKMNDRTAMPEGWEQMVASTTPSPAARRMARQQHMAYNEEPRP